MWYKNYEKGKPFYTVSTQWTIQKNYYAGWCSMEHYDGSISEHILTMSGGQMNSTMTGLGSPFMPFPEEDLEEVVGKIKELKEAQLLRAIDFCERKLKASRDAYDDRENWEPKMIDFKGGEPYDYHGETYGRFDGDHYREVHIA